MTEDKARQKWCPFAAMANDTTCIASSCMMWVKDGEIGRRLNGQIVKKDLTGDVEWIEDGHCGLINRGG